LDYHVIFQPYGRRGDVPSGTSLLEAGQKLGISIRSDCGGGGTCGKCKVQVVSENRPPAKQTVLSPLTAEELEYLTAEEIDRGFRLACQAYVLANVLISIPEESRELNQIILESGVKRTLHLNPAVRAYAVHCPAGSLTNQTADWERVKFELEHNHNLPQILIIDYSALISLPDVLRKQNGEVTLYVWENKEVIGVQAGLESLNLGVAIDLGSTTVVAYLCDLTNGKVLGIESIVNPQVKYGEDVLARITYALNGPESLNDLHNIIIDGINSLIKKLNNHTHTAAADIHDVVIVGNTVMHHLLLKINPQYLGRLPFLAAIQSAVDLRARDLGIQINPGGKIYILPNEGGFVGADNVADLIAEEPYNGDKLKLIIDIGTNGEIALANRKILAVTSCATGPAMEGAQIKFGMRAATGAIERVTIDPENLKTDYKVIGKDEWASENPATEARGICGSGIIDIVAELFKSGVINKTGKFVMSAPSARLRKNDDGKIEFVIAWKEETAIGKDITITQGDIRAIQLAKAALYTGAKYLMSKYNIEKVDEIILAGAFGNYIKPENALLLGMFPDCPLEDIIAVGNAAGDGAKSALLDVDKRFEAQEIARRSVLVETAVETDFQAQFAYAIYIPHAKDNFPQLKSILEKIPQWDKIVTTNK
jgi:uncharacterized 2Fe-2S/4Fe-4S cluster protein (DUF4445 family)